MQVGAAWRSLWIFQQDFKKCCPTFKTESWSPFLSVCVQACLTLCDSMDWGLPGSSVQGISQARILKWVAISFSRGFSKIRDWTWVSCIGKWILYHWASWKALLSLMQGHKSLKIPQNISGSREICSTWTHLQVSQISYMQHPRLLSFFFPIPPTPSLA